MRKTAFFVVLFFLWGLLPARAASLQIEAPGGMKSGQDDAISAYGLPGKPLRAVLEDYEVRAQALFYNIRRREATFSGEVVLQVQEEKTRTTLRAEKLVLTLGAQTARAEGRVDLAFEEEGLYLEAAAVEADLRRETYVLVGRPAVARFRESHRFAARRLVYDRKATRLTVEEEVVWEMTCQAGKRTLTATRGEYDRTRGLLELMEVTAAEKDLRLQAGRLVYEEETERFHLTENPRLAQGDERSLTAASIAWEPAKELYYASGEVTFRDPVYTGTAHEAFYEPAAKRLLLRGEARLARGEDFVLGAEILYDFGAGRLRVDGGAKARILLAEET
ncbi:MAG: hypothetical protein GX493_00620 [Firmicutes bacterium]|nr:hypothetical protein [Bacillota bacterium]